MLTRAELLVEARALRDRANAWSRLAETLTGFQQMEASVNAHAIDLALNHVYALAGYVDDLPDAPDA